MKITESEEADVYTSTLAITKLDVSFSKAMFKCSVSSGSTSHTSSFALAGELLLPQLLLLLLLRRLLLSVYS